MTTNRLIFSLLALMLFTSRHVPAADDTRTEYEQVKQEAVLLGKAYASLPPESEQRETTRSNLKRLVETAFDLRQKLQRDEVRAARVELESIENRIAEREQLRDIMVGRKLEELLLAKEPEWGDDDPAGLSSMLAADKIQPGDTVTAYLAGVLPYNAPNEPQAPPPVSMLKTGRAVSGYPLVVASDGTVKFPIIPPVKIAGLTVREAETKVADAYIESKVLRPKDANPILTLVPQPDRVVSILTMPKNAYHSSGKIQPGDTVAAYMEGILPFSKPNQPPEPPPLLTLNSGRTVSGYPLVVAADGTLKFPVLPPIKIAGLTIAEAEGKVAKTYVDQGILKPDKAVIILALVPQPDRVVSIMTMPKTAEK